MNKLSTLTLIASLITASVLSATNFVSITDLGSSARSIALGNVDGYSNSADAVFSIESNPKETIVRVAEGLVEITQNRDNYKGNRTPLSIKPSQIGIIKINTRGAIKTVNKDPNFLAWANQILLFQNTPLSEVASVMERVYGYQLKFIDITASKCLLSRSYVKQTPKEIAAAISKIFGFDYTIVDRTIMFEGSCL